MILLNPGPVTLSSGVRSALTSEDLCHREPEFAELQDDIRARLLAVYGLKSDNWAAVLLAGSGTAAVEAMLTGMVPRNGHVLVIENGVYGERMKRMLEIHAIAHTTHSLAWGEVIAADAVRSVLETEPGITHLAVVHHETTTGRLNDLQELGAVCQSANVKMLVDGVSSFGAEDLKFSEWNIAAVAATANKCLHASPGVSFVMAERQSLKQAGDIQRSLYLNLADYCHAQDRQNTPFTQPVHLYYALRQALLEFAEQGGWQARHNRYAELAHSVRMNLQNVNVTPLLEESESSVVLNAYYLPEGVTYERLHDGLKQRGFVIYAGQGSLHKTLFRISTMGAISDADLERLNLALREVIQTSQ